MTIGKDLLHDPGARRMTGFFLTSIVVHIALMLATGLPASRSQQPIFLQAELRTVQTETREPLAREGPVSEVVPPQRVEKHEPVAKITPPDKHLPLDAPKMLNLPADIYYASSEVDTRAEPLNEVNLVYPMVAYQQRIAGKVRINIFVNEQGGIDKTVVVDSAPAGVFEEAALQAVTELAFSPALKNGNPVKNRKTIEVTFDPYETIRTP